MAEFILDPSYPPRQIIRQTDNSSKYEDILQVQRSSIDGLNNSKDTTKTG